MPILVKFASAILTLAAFSRKINDNSKKKKKKKRNQYPFYNVNAMEERVIPEHNFNSLYRYWFHFIITVRGHFAVRLKISYS